MPLTSGMTGAGATTGFTMATGMMGGIAFCGMIVVTCNKKKRGVTSMLRG